MASLSCTRPPAPHCYRTRPSPSEVSTVGSSGVLQTRITRLFNLSIATSTTPQQWKRATIMPVPKKPTPKEHADFRPISITPVLTRILERIIVKQFIYPAILSPPATLSFDDQYAFRPTGSPTAAIISLLHTVTNMLTSNPYVIVLSLDFSKAFDTVRHSTLMKKLA